MLIKTIIIGLALCLVNLFLKKQLNEFVLPLEIAFLAMSSYLLIGYFEEIFGGINEISSQTEFAEEILSSTVKGAGICLVTKFSSDICTESGNKLIGDIIEFTGRIMLVIIVIPYVEAIIKTAFAFVK